MTRNRKDFPMTIREFAVVVLDETARILAAVQAVVEATADNLTPASPNMLDRLTWDRPTLCSTCGEIIDWSECEAHAAGHRGPQRGPAGPSGQARGR